MLIERAAHCHPLAINWQNNEILSTQQRLWSPCFTDDHIMPSPFLSRLLATAAPGRLDPKWALFSSNSFIAAMLAIYFAFRLGLERPYWAMLTVYLTAQPFAGAVRSRAVYRFVGTLLGACVALALVPILVDQPALLSVAVTAWAGLCLYISLQDRTPRSYAFLLAGYTATTIAFSSVNVPAMVFVTALSRVEEILLGIGCATLVHTLLFPSDVTTPVLKSLCAALSDAFARTTDVLCARVDKAPNTGVHGLDDVAAHAEIAQAALGLEPNHPFPRCGGCGEAHLLQMLKATDHQAPDLGIGLAGVLWAKIDRAGLICRQADLPIEPRPSFRRDLPLQRTADLMLWLWTQFDSDQFLGARAQAPADVVAGDHQIRPFLIYTPDEKVDVRVVGIPMIDSHPIEPRAEIGLHLHCEIAGEGLEIGHIARILR
ncbi:hypothetical protein ABIA00_005655 [Bradyrhizobium ottawaense]|nr:FUSC family protein [Bradyrhizobium ottawaense]MBR1331779.1 FUSC family protein [Bradyrhizobium ottawaense]